eukprot:6066823-Amphidinium_carterae.1
MIWVSLHACPKVAATHCFDKSVLDTVVEDNVNPIDKVGEVIAQALKTKDHPSEPQPKWGSDERSAQQRGAIILWGA